MNINSSTTYSISTEQGTYSSVESKKHFQYVRRMNRDSTPVVSAWVFNRQTQSWEPIKATGW